MYAKLQMSVVVLAIAFFALPILSALAQIQSGDVSLSLTPRYPRPNESVSAALSTYASDLDRARITWLLDGRVMIEAFGQKSFSFTAPAAGSRTLLQARIEAADGSLIEKTIAISPAAIDLLWQGVDSYVPPFYKGKALVPTEGSYKIVAIPANGSAKNFAYRWEQDGKTSVTFSGFGKSSYTFKNTYLETENEINVTVSDLAGNGIGTGTTTVRPSEPHITFYAKDPISGQHLPRAIGNGFFIPEGGAIISAEPYFFSPKDLESPDLQMSWYLNGAPISSDVKNEIGIKPESGSEGSARIRLTVKNLKRLFLNREKQIDVTF